MFKLFLVMYAAAVLAGFTCMFVAAFLPDVDRTSPADAIGFQNTPEDEDDAS